MARTLSDVQRDVDEFISQFEEGYFHPMTLIVRLTEELGELAREVNHHYGEKKKKATEPEGSIALELGDMLIVMACLANRLNLSLDDAHTAVMEKFRTRDANRFTRKDVKQ
ncbi:nucleotide pyrophosphohydrolase [Ferroacidibacillus organovorans]|uniref:Nucleotide pyrophosphohydrolase n=1 Tax=Ferroacidibacillus organovorans TaxID=1765683 RepID=A0A101XSQ2_9BACL|nr:nucleotide pyrophosphohydrolase [Ferroacidibacillus organovorans]KUO96848.1 nucleotide pyrophosphohydrolase [Ferroacidibacillus organovorans]